MQRPPFISGAAPNSFRWVSCTVAPPAPALAPGPARGTTGTGVAPCPRRGLLGAGLGPPEPRGRSGGRGQECAAHAAGAAAARQDPIVERRRLRGPAGPTVGGCWPGEHPPGTQAGWGRGSPPWVPGPGRVSHGRGWHRAPASRSRLEPPFQVGRVWGAAVTQGWRARPSPGAPAAPGAPTPHRGEPPDPRARPQPLSDTEPGADPAADPAATTVSLAEPLPPQQGGTRGVRCAGPRLLCG